MRKLLYLILLLHISLPLSAQPEDCANEDILLQMLDYGDLFFGETHGSVEIPNFMACLVEKALDTSDEPIIVSLEMSEDVRDIFSPFWNVQNLMYEDGRSSQAMFHLLNYLLEKEGMGLLELHFQVSKGVKAIGSELKELSTAGLVIALAGNAHSLKNRLPGMSINYEREGMFVGENFTHIELRSANGGETWACPGLCGLMTIGEWTGAIRGSLIDGVSAGHDYIYFLDIEKYTASYPMRSNE